MPSPWEPLRPVLRAHRLTLARASLWLFVLAVATGAYGLLAGPVLRSLFGGDGGDGGRLFRQLRLAAWAEWIPLMVVGVASLKALAARHQVVSQAICGQRIVADLRVQAHTALLARSPAAVHRWGAGDVLVRLTDDAERVEALVTLGLIGAARDALQVLVLVALCLALDPGLALLFFGAYPLALWPMAVLGRRLRRAAGTAAAERAALAVEVHQQLHRLPLLQVMVAGRWAGGRFRAAGDAVASAVLRSARLRAVASPLMEVLGAVALAVTVVYARRRIDAGSLSAEQVLSFLASALLLYAPVKGLTRWAEVVAPGLAALARLDALTREPEGVPTVEFRGEVELGDGPPLIVFQDVVVDRGDGRGVALGAARFDPGRITAVLGANGSGKSTLAAALLGWLPLVRGSITLDGEPLLAHGRDNWRRCVGWVPQGAMLARGTLWENVALGAPADRAAGSSLAAEVGLDALLGRLPAGWDTELADAGEGLSGGEQRRLALARALLRRPRVLILDEPEAGLDAAALEAFARLLPQLAVGRTVILLTHNHRLAQQADVRVLLDPPEADRPREETPCSPPASVG